MNEKRTLFLDFCSEITGYSPLELETTGLVDLYQELLEKILGARLSDFYVVAQSMVDASDDSYPTDADPGKAKKLVSLLTSSTLFWPVAQALIRLWYLGYWTQLPNEWYAQAGLPLPGPTDAGRTHTPSSLAYIEQLSYRTADAHPPGAKPTGFGSWSWKPAI